MASTHITVCIVTLTQKDESDLTPAAFVSLLASAKSHYDFSVAGKPYDVSPDDWRPFAGGSTILSFLQAANLKPTFMSTQLFDPSTNLEARKRADLYVIDPVVLMHKNKRDFVSGTVQATIVAGVKEFCIVLPRDLPAPVRSHLEAECEALLGDLKNAWLHDDLGAWEIDRPLALEKFCNSMFNRLQDEPSSSVLELLAQRSREAGAQVILLNTVPKMR